MPIRAEHDVARVGDVLRHDAMGPLGEREQSAGNGVLAFPRAGVLGSGGSRSIRPFASRLALKAFIAISPLAVPRKVIREKSGIE